MDIQENGEEFEALGLCCGYGSKAVFSGLTLSLKRGQICVFLGPNGVGKTTIIKTLSGLIPPLEGGVFYGGRNISSIPPIRRSEIIGYVPQKDFTPFSFTVMEAVTLGRLSGFGFWGRPAPADLEAARSILEILDMEHLAGRGLHELSGGQRQLVSVARALAQDPELLILDEPAASLDLQNQERLLTLLRYLARERGLGILLSTHCPDHGFLLGGSAVLFGSSGFTAQGDVLDVLTEDNLTRAYGIPIRLIAVPEEDLRIARAQGGRAEVMFPRILTSGHPASLRTALGSQA
jgi:ABC-type cobalamin/Fe3+-siderophores transport system ATPase subunit